MADANHLASNLTELSNITCEQFGNLSDVEKRLFVIGVANGRGMTAGLFQAYANAAQDFAIDEMEKSAIAKSFETIRGMMAPLLEIDANSLLNGIKAASSYPEFRDMPVINAIAHVHVNAAKSLKKESEFRSESHRD